MGKRARLKKQAKIERILEQRHQVEVRKIAARSPVLRITRLVIIALIVTVALLYVGRMVNQRIAKAAESIEASR